MKGIAKIKKIDFISKDGQVKTCIRRCVSTYTGKEYVTISNNLGMYLEDFEITMSDWIKDYLNNNLIESMVIE